MQWPCLVGMGTAEAGPVDLFLPSLGPPLMTAACAITDPILREEYLEAIVQRRLGARVRDLRLIIRGDGIILQGRATTYHAKQLAQHAVMELAAGPILANDIEVH